MKALEQALGTAVVANNERIHRVDTGRGNPRSLDGLVWHQRLVEQYPAIRADWDAFVERNGRLPLIEDLIVEHQGNEGPWRAGILWSKGKPVRPMDAEFPATITALRGIPGLRSALWSLMEPGTELPEHTGPNAGMLRYHLGIRCNQDSALQVGDTIVTYRDGEGVLFDDTAPHAAWNRGSEPRITLFCEIERPLDGYNAMMNRMVQRVISLDSRYRNAPRRAAQWHRALNRGRSPSSGA